jgi:hypothetical protein
LNDTTHWIAARTLLTSAAPSGAGDLHRQHPGARRDALPSAAGARPVAGDHPGDEGAVAIGVVAVELAGEVLARLGRAESVRDLDDAAGEVGHLGDAGVDQRDGDPLAGHAVAPGVVGAHDLGVDGADLAAGRSGRAPHLDLAVGRDGPDPGHAGQVGGCPAAWQGGREPAHDRQDPEDLPPSRCTASSGPR